jgi:hypothetical protein
MTTSINDRNRGKRMSLLAELNLKSKRFHAEIERRASMVRAREDRSYSIPNAPYGVPKAPPQPRKVYVVDPEFYYPCMWFYDLVTAPIDPVERIVNIAGIRRATAEHFKMSEAELMANRRFRPIVRARQVAMYLCKILTTRSLLEIGRRFGGRDHTTVLHAVRQIERLLPEDATIAAAVDVIQRDHLQRQGVARDLATLSRPELGAAEKT